MLIDEVLPLMRAVVAGGLLGGVFFGGLWWTVQKGATSDQPALWFFGSLLLRMSTVLAGFYLVSDGQWQWLLTCLLGFVIARTIVLRLTRPSPSGHQLPAVEISHAS